MKYQLNLQRFAEEGTGSAAPEAAPAETAAAENAEMAPITGGETLAGQPVSSQVAAEMNRQMAKHPELRNVYGKARTRAQAPAQQAEAQPEPESIEDRWNGLIKGEYKEQYGKSVQEAVRERFKNQTDNGEQLKALEPMLNVLRERAGVKTNEELIHHVMDDDSLYEEAASEAGMTVPAYRQFMQLQQERDEAQKREQQTIQQQMTEKHFAKLCQQAEEFKKVLPDFDLNKMLQEDEKFFVLTTPEVGLSVEQAFYALHHNEIMPQAMMAGMERAKAQMGQTIQAQHRRPAEGAQKSRGPQAADFNIDPRSLSRPERNRIYDLIHKGKMTWGG